MYHAVERTTRIGTGINAKERLKVRTFRHRQDVHAFLNKGDNAQSWRESTKGLPEGIYAFVGGRWHNVKHLDVMTLAHV